MTEDPYKVGDRVIGPYKFMGTVRSVFKKKDKKKVSETTAYLYLIDWDENPRANHVQFAHSQLKEPHALEELGACAEPWNLTRGRQRQQMHRLPGNWDAVTGTFITESKTGLLIGWIEYTFGQCRIKIMKHLDITPFHPDVLREL